MMNPDQKQPCRCSCCHSCCCHSKHNHDLPPSYSEHVFSRNKHHGQTNILCLSEPRPLRQTTSNDGNNPNPQPAQNPWARTTTKIDFLTKLLENHCLRCDSEKYWNTLDKSCEKGYPFALKIARWRAEQGITRESSAAERMIKKAQKEARRRCCCKVHVCHK
jgi:hypothetical protein